MKHLIALIHREELFRKGLALLTQKEGFAVSEAATFAEAKAMWQKKNSLARPPRV